MVDGNGLSMLGSVRPFGIVENERIRFNLRRTQHLVIQHIGPSPVIFSQQIDVSRIQGEKSLRDFSTVFTQIGKNDLGEVFPTQIIRILIGTGGQCRLRQGLSGRLVILDLSTDILLMRHVDLDGRTLAVPQTGLFNHKVDRNILMRDIIFIDIGVPGDITGIVNNRDIHTGIRRIGIRTVTARCIRVSLNLEFDHEFLTGASILITPADPIIFATIFKADDSKLSIFQRYAYLARCGLFDTHRRIITGIDLLRSHGNSRPPRCTVRTDSPGVNDHIGSFKGTRNLETVGDTVHNLGLTRNRRLRTGRCLTDGLEDIGQGVLLAYSEVIRAIITVYVKIRSGHCGRVIRATLRQKLRKVR